MKFSGSEEMIRLHFEEYLLALLSAVKYRLYLETHKGNDNALLTDFGNWYPSIGISNMLTKH